MKTVVVPRDAYENFKADTGMSEDLPVHGVYFLLDEYRGNIRKLYVGQTTNGFDRFNSHYQSKDWWNVLVIHLDNEDNFTQETLSYLETELYDYATSHGYYEIDNRCRPSKKNKRRGFKSIINNYRDDILFRMKILGFYLEKDQPVCRNRSQKTSNPKKRSSLQKDAAPTQFICQNKSKGIVGYMTFDPVTEKCTVLAGSRIRWDLQPKGEAAQQLRGELYKEAVDGELSTDTEFTSPSAAADFVLGGSRNGWREWKTPDGKKLNDLYRNKVKK